MIAYRECATSGRWNNPNKNLKAAPDVPRRNQDTLYRDIWPHVLWEAML